MTARWVGVTTVPPTTPTVSLALLRGITVPWASARLLEGMSEYGD